MVKSQRLFDQFSCLCYNSNIYIIYFLLVMLTWISIISCIIIVLVLGYVFFYFFSLKIEILERKIINLFRSRTDVFPILYETSKATLSRHDEIFREAFLLRKKEFSLLSISHSIESFIELEWKIHHEINFIFQVCNKNPELLRNGDFLYIRDVMVEKSSEIAREIKKYRRVIEIHNQIIKYKNYSLLWLILPFHKKSVV